MDVQSLSAQQMANIIRLEVFMDNHQTQGLFYFTYSMSTSIYHHWNFNATHFHTVDKYLRKMEKLPLWPTIFCIFRIFDEDNNETTGSAWGHKTTSKF